MDVQRQLFRKIKLPLISSTVTINVILAVISGLKAFDYSFIMTNGGPGKSTKTLMFQVYETALRYEDGSCKCILCTGIRIYYRNHSNYASLYE